MSVKFACACGKHLKVPESHLGKRVRCPACGRISKAQAPAAEKPSSLQDPDIYELAEQEQEAPPSPAGRTCPQCGQAMTAKQTHCPACGVDPHSGQLPAGGAAAAAPSPSLEDAGRGIAMPEWVRSLGVHVLFGAASGAFCLALWALAQYFFGRLENEPLLFVLIFYAILGALYGGLILAAVWVTGSALAGYVTGAALMAAERVLLVQLVGLPGGFTVLALVAGAFWGALFAWVCLSGIKSIQEA